MGLAFEPGGERIEVHFLQIVSAARSSREAEVGVLRAALILGDDVLVERAACLPSNQYVRVWSVALQLTSTLCQLPSVALPHYRSVADR